MKCARLEFQHPVARVLSFFARRCVGAEDPSHLGGFPWFPFIHQALRAPFQLLSYAFHAFEVSTVSLVRDARPLGLSLLYTMSENKIGGLCVKSVGEGMVKDDSLEVAAGNRIVQMDDVELWGGSKTSIDVNR